MDNKEALIRKLKALRDKANDPSIKGTPEAISAMAKYNELMAKYNLTVDDLEVRSSPLGSETRSNTEHNNTVIGHLAVLIGMFTETRVLQRGQEIAFVGLQSDIQHAGFLYDVICTAFDNGKKAYITSPEFAKLMADGQDTALTMKLFEMGMTIPLDQALRAMIEEKKVRTPSNALVVLKQALIAQALGEENNGTASMDVEVRMNDAAFHTGLREAGKVSLRKNVESDVKGYLK